jgi:ribonuclease M5
MIRVNETIVVEGKDDEAAVRRADADANIITTSGYGLSEETILRIRAAYERTGIVIFTDPDHAGRSIRDRLTQLFPAAKQAYLAAKEARKKDDLGIENASPEAIERALRIACGDAEEQEPREPVTLSDLERLGLAGRSDSARKREEAGARLGIGYANAKAFLRRLNGLGIPLAELTAALEDREAAEKE